MPESRRGLSLPQVIEEISSAFSGVSLDGGITLHEARAIDDWKSKEEQLAERAKDPETSWEELSDEKLCYFDDVLNFLGDKGWVFYIPAYMLWVLRHLGKSDVHSDLDYMAIYSITFPNVRSERSSLLNTAQGRAVCHFLRYLGDNSKDWRMEAEEALENCWSRFCQGEAE